MLFEADSPHVYGPGTRLRGLTTRSYTPVFVFLDATGKKVFETSGFRTAREGRALHEFVSKRHYLKTTWQDYVKQAAK